MDPVIPPTSQDLAADQELEGHLSALLIKECGLHSPGSSTYRLLQRAAAMANNYGQPVHPSASMTPEELDDIGNAYSYAIDAGYSLRDLRSTDVWNNLPQPIQLDLSQAHAHIESMIWAIETFVPEAIPAPSDGDE
jgi:hypothetical protein